MASSSGEIFILLNTSGHAIITNNDSTMAVTNKIEIILRLISELSQNLFLYFGKNPINNPRIINPNAQKNIIVLENVNNNPTNMTA